MKKLFKSLLLTTLTVSIIFALSACRKKDEKAEDLWENATYLTDREFGSGNKTITVEVAAEDKKVTFTIHTDSTTVGTALLENELIAGEDGAYGLYVKVVNGITADYDIDQSYWAFYIDNQLASSGVDTTEISEESIYKLEYAK